MNYAIVEISGRQVWIEPGKFYDLNYVPGNPGDKIYLNRVLFISHNNIVKIGTPCLQSICVKTKIIKHIKGRKLTILKMKPKKNIRYKRGHRQQLTRLLIEDIL
uniref:50S ribosomal protein L21, chloroplastic n=1 Tax=Nitophyllum punctatum TaxID=158729 RepID=A0A4D6WYK8_9FLOR|nr:ribosomal protein L21 [Nitophyllum punctatum]